ncbi:NineTeen Complex (NTC) component, partial [Datura stramonium]|nr:NineTeen Complex (NTC) component [Datura stramonium]
TNPSSHPNHRRANPYGNVQAPEIEPPNWNITDHELADYRLAKRKDRAVTLLPWVYRLWYKYIHMKFELRYNEVERARAIFERFVQCLPKVSAWIGFAKFEMKNGEIGRARNCYERAVDKLADDHEEPEQLLVAFAEFEDKCKKTERAREGIEDAIVGKEVFSIMRRMK